jgi:hypothetical protein
LTHTLQIKLEHNAAGPSVLACLLLSGVCMRHRAGNAGLVRFNIEAIVSQYLNRYAEWMDKSTVLAEAGDADGSVEAHAKATELSEQHDALRLELITPERVKSVCEVCGVYTNSTDNEARREVRLVPS